MKKYLKYIGIVISLVALLGIIFFAMDFCRVNNKKNPIFCIKTKVYEDGGTREFLGLGYKVIDFHTINGFYETKIGSYFMKYEDFDDEISKYDNIVIDEIVKSEEYIKQIENAIIKHILIWLAYTIAMVIHIHIIFNNTIKLKEISASFFIMF